MLDPRIIVFFFFIRICCDCLMTSNQLEIRVSKMFYFSINVGSGTLVSLKYLLMIT